MYEHAVKILDIADEMKRETQENEDVLSGKLILGAATRGLGNPFPLLYKKFKKSFPEIELTVQTEYTLEQVIEKVKNGKIDIGFVSHDLDLTDLAEVPYGVYELILVVGKNHPLAEKKVIVPDDLHNQKWVMFDAANRISVSTEDYLSKIGIMPRNIYTTNDGSLVRSIIEYNNRISLLPEWGVFEELGDGRFVKIKVKGINYKIQVNLIWKPSRRTKLLSAVMTYLLEEKLKGIKPLDSE